MACLVGGSGKRLRAYGLRWRPCVRLSADLTTLDPGDDKLCRQALADAGERATAAGSLTGTAKTATEMLVALRIVVEGLHATQIVRERQGLPPGPDLPEINPAGAVQEPTPVSVDGEQLTAHPHYHPDRPHFFEGGSVAGVNVLRRRLPHTVLEEGTGHRRCGGRRRNPRRPARRRRPRFGDYSDDNGWDGGDNDGGW